MGEKDFLELGGSEDLNTQLQTKSTLCGFEPKPTSKVKSQQLKKKIVEMSVKWGRVQPPYHNFESCLFPPTYC